MTPSSAMARISGVSNIFASRFGIWRRARSTRSRSALSNSTCVTGWPATFATVCWSLPAKRL